MKLSFALAGAAAVALFALTAPGAAQARERGWSRACACAPKVHVRRHAHRRVRKAYSSYRPVLAVDSIPIVVQTQRGAILVGQGGRTGWWFPHPTWGYDYPWDGYGGPYYGYPPPRDY